MAGFQQAACSSELQPEAAALQQPKTKVSLAVSGRASPPKLSVYVRPKEACYS